jgi:hypothetical protein
MQRQKGEDNGKALRTDWRRGLLLEYIYLEDEFQKK